MSKTQLMACVAIVSITVAALAAADAPVSTKDARKDAALAENSPKLLMIRSKGKFGLIDRTGKLILPARYESLMGFDSSYRASANAYLEIAEGERSRPVQIDHKWGYVDNTGKEMIPAQYSMAGPFRDGWAQVKDGKTWGIIDHKGKFVIKPQYSFIGPFRDGIARVAIGGMPIEGGLPKSKWGYINKKGDQIIPVTYDYAQSLSNGRALVNIGGKWRGNAGISFQGGKWGVVDNSGAFVVEPKIEIAGGLSLDEKTEVDAADLVPIKFDGKFGYRDRSWKLAIEPQFDEARPFSEQLAVTSQASKFGYINKSGQWAIKPSFLTAGDFSEGLAPVTTEKGVRFIDKQGTEILKLNYDEAQSFHSGLAAVRFGKLWGYINKTGQYVHQPQFARIYDPGGEFLSIENAVGLRGLMNREGRIVVPPKYGFIGAFQKNGFAMIDTESMGLPSEFWVIDREGRLIPGPMLPFDAGDRSKKILFLPKRAGGIWGITNEKGAFVIAPRFSNVQMLAVGILGVQEGPKWGMVDLENGKLIIEPTYHSIDRFSEGLAAVKPDPYEFPVKSKRVGYIDPNGKLVIPKTFFSGAPFKAGIAVVQLLYQGDTDWYYIDKKGQYLWHPSE